MTIKPDDLGGRDFEPDPTDPGPIPETPTNEELMTRATTMAHLIEVYGSREGRGHEAARVIRELRAEVATLSERLEAAERLANEMEFDAKMALPEAQERFQRAEAERDRLREALARAVSLAEHLFQMIDPQTWRDSGGDDGQGHYEGEYRAAELREELAALRSSEGG